MRIRQIKPDYWRDRLLATLSADVREFYIGLWMQADDSGWMRWEVGELGADLYPYQPVAKRERHIAAWGRALCDAGRVVVHECGHAELPTLVRHQRLSGAAKQVHTYKREHEIRCSPPIPADSRADPLLPARNGKEREGTEGDIGGTTGSDREAAITTLRAIVDDPTKSDQQKRAARRGLEQFGVAA